MMRPPQMTSRDFVLAMRYGSATQSVGQSASVSTLALDLVAGRMEYRGVEFSVAQGLGRKLWRWYLTINGVWLSGEAETQFAAVAEARKGC